MVDVQRLMQDLTVEQLVQIQSSFDNEIENKKEELRQMVGRRYRDVLEASNTVKRLTEIANELVSELNDVGKASSMTEKTSAALASEKAKPSSAAHTFFVVLNSLLPQIGSTNDSLSNVFCLLLAESFHRRFSTSVETGGVSSISNSLSQTIFKQLLVSRLELADKLLNELGSQTDWQIVAGHLSALALLKQLPVDALLDAYLQSRTDTIFLSLKSSNTSLIGIIRMIKSTTQAIDAVFGQETVTTIIEDQLYCYARLFTDEIPKVNASYAKSATSRPIVPMTISDVERKCSDWVDKMCSLSSERVRAMCDFENSQQLVEFVAAISQLFRSDWPSIASNLSIYQRLFGNSIADRFRFLIDKELSTLEINLISEVTKVNCNPMPLFQKRAVKFDALLASGVSHELNELALFCLLSRYI
ncbi:vps51/Vps67 domain-containing protein [Ditylenchus destructor]|nr:vps51/Vps67 domain-containing protein [Ditylenchus destructor]